MVWISVAFLWQRVKSYLLTGRRRHSRKDYVLRPRSIEELQSVVREAYQRGLEIKCAGGDAFIAEPNPGEVFVSLQNLDRTVHCDVINRSFTVESGVRLDEVLGRLEAAGLTLPMQGTLPNLALVDAVAIGLVGSRGCISDAVEACEVVTPSGELSEWRWRGMPELLAAGAVDAEAALFLGVPNRALESLVCGLGYLGIVTKCTLRCQELSMVCESSYVMSLYELLHNGPRLADGDAYADIYWFPLLDKCVVIKAAPSPTAPPQPRHLCWAEFALWRVQGLLAHLAALPFAGALSRLMASMQFALLLVVLFCREGYSLKPQRLVPEECARSGARWWVPRGRVPSLLEELEQWLSWRRPAMGRGAASAPVWLAVPLADCGPRQQGRDAYLSPVRPGSGATLWCDYLQHVPRIPGFNFNWMQEELEAIFHRHGGHRCWYPCTPSTVAKRFPRFHWWRAARRAADPLGMFESVYICGEIR